MKYYLPNANLKFNLINLISDMLNIVYILAIVCVFSGCKENRLPSLPAIETIDVSAITSVSASSGGNIYEDGGSTIIGRGVCWGTESNPSLTGNHTSDGTGDGSFTSLITGLTSETQYFVRAYAVNSAGIEYGNEVTFSTLTQVSTIVTTTTVTSITTSTAISGGTVTSAANITIIARGVCWSTSSNPTIDDSHTSEFPGVGVFISEIEGLSEATTYYVRAYATDNSGTIYGNEIIFTTASVNPAKNQIIADHTVVNKFNIIPAEYISEVKKMWLVVAGESHSSAIRGGMELLEKLYPAYASNERTAGTPEGYTSSHLRVSGGTWGDYSNASGWIYWYGEEDWFTNAIAIERTKAGIRYCNSNNLKIAAIGLGWCADLTEGSGTDGTDPVYGCHWYGNSLNGPEGNKPVGIDAFDTEVTGNSVCLDTYLDATQQYIDFCKTNGYLTKVFFTTGPVDPDDSWYGEKAFQGHLKHEHIRYYVKSDSLRILFDYADILCHDDDGTHTTINWNNHTIPTITARNNFPVTIGHISDAGAIRLAKAMWWMLARIAGWDGK